MVDDTHAAQVTEIETMTADYLRENASAVIPVEISGGCFYSVATEPWISKVWRRLGFRRAGVGSPRTTPPTGFPGNGFIVVESVTHFDWIDRLRILISGKVSSEHVVHTDVAVGQAHTETDVAVLPPWRK